jgi:Ca2+-binding RTX toxin-like protein
MTTSHSVTLTGLLVNRLYYFEVCSTDVAENGFSALTGTISDPGTLDTFELVVDWGDGSTPEVFNYAAGRTSFSEVHQYLDDAPSGTPSDEYNITLTVIDDDGGEASAETDLTVSNAAPEIKSLVSSAPEVGDAKPGDLVTVSGLFADIGTLDTHAAIIDWGDGTMTLAVIDQTGDSFSGTHVYTTGGIFDIEVVLSDDDLGNEEARTTALVTGARVKDGELQVVGTHSNDWVEMNEVGRKGYKVHADFLSDSCHYLYFNTADVECIKILLGDGNDHASIAGNIDIPVTIDGGAGDDHLNGGHIPAILIDAPGNDKAIGSQVDDKICGGDGNKTIPSGDCGNDIIMDAGAGNDRVLGVLDDDIVVDGDGKDRGAGDGFPTGGNDLPVGDLGYDELNGGKGDDKLIDWTCKEGKPQPCHEMKMPPCSAWVSPFVCDVETNNPNENIKIALSPAGDKGCVSSGDRKR